MEFEDRVGARQAKTCRMCVRLEGTSVKALGLSSIQQQYQAFGEALENGGKQKDNTHHP